MGQFIQTVLLLRLRFMKYYRGFKPLMNAILVLFQTDIITPDRRQSKTLIISRNVDQQSLETEFSNVICRLTQHCLHCICCLNGYKHCTDVLC